MKASLLALACCAGNLPSGDSWGSWSKDEIQTMEEARQACEPVKASCSTSAADTSNILAYTHSVRTSQEPISQYSSESIAEHGSGSWPPFKYISCFRRQEWEPTPSNDRAGINQGSSISPSDSVRSLVQVHHRGKGTHRFKSTTQPLWMIADHSGGVSQSGGEQIAATACNHNPTKPTKDVGVASETSMFRFERFHQYSDEYDNKSNTEDTKRDEKTNPPVPQVDQAASSLLSWDRCLSGESRPTRTSRPARATVALSSSLWVKAPLLAALIPHSALRSSAGTHVSLWGLLGIFFAYTPAAQAQGDLGGSPTGSPPADGSTNAKDNAWVLMWSLVSVVIGLVVFSAFCIASIQGAAGRTAAQEDAHQLDFWGFWIAIIAVVSAFVFSQENSTEGMIVKLGVVVLYALSLSSFRLAYYRTTPLIIGPLRLVPLPMGFVATITVGPLLAMLFATDFTLTTIVFSPIAFWLAVLVWPSVFDHQEAIVNFAITIWPWVKRVAARVSPKYFGNDATVQDDVHAEEGLPSGKATTSGSGAPGPSNDNDSDDEDDYEDDSGPVTNHWDASSWNNEELN